jgi:ABC-2 type transport system permease protein
MQWAMGIIMTLVFGAMAIFRISNEAPPVAKPFIATGLLTMTLFMLVQSIGNVFGFDRAGFRAFVLAPISRRFILIGKNLANLPVLAAIGLIVLIFTTVRMKLPVTVAIAVLFQFAILFLLVSILGNALSIYLPYRVRAGSMKPTKLPAKVQLVMFATHLLFPVVMIPAFIPSIAQAVWDYAGWTPIPINLILSVLLAAGAGIAYWMSLEPFARLLQQREQQILEVLGSDVE